MASKTSSPEAVNKKPNSEVTPTQPSIEPEQHSLLKSIIMHLLPGALIMLFYVISAPFFVNLGFPPLFALCLGILVILIPVELGYLLYKGKKANGKISLKNIVLYRERLSLPIYLMYGFLILVWSTLSFLILQKPVGNFITNHLFSWAPGWYTGANSFEGTKPILLASWIMLMVFGNILGPAVEELYFRGYLLPRISRFKGWAPLLNAVLFSAYHFWSPWDIITRIIAVLPISFTAYKKKNIYIGIIVHWTLNTLSSISLLALIFK